jgi:orotidine-5'-phosphate decarboxylase
MKTGGKRMLERVGLVAETVKRDVPSEMKDRLIVALDAPSVPEARSIVSELKGLVSFFKIGLWLQFARGVDDLIDELIESGNRIFLDAKMYDVPETVHHAVATATKRQISFITVHGDEKIMTAAVTAKGESAVKIFAVTVLTSLDNEALKDMGYGVSARELVSRRAKLAVQCKCDGVIASADDDPDMIRMLSEMPSLLIATPGIRPAGSPAQDHRRVATPSQAIANGADFLVVGRPIVAHPDRAMRAQKIIAEMEHGAVLALAKTFRTLPISAPID